ncbi:hypothetical protein DL98DRAFT_268277 [Cadophora sp. DSE1049]|nr:hypothetical protein DL98DRAFT_268277 [Cadophora sp. DSE1049]
MDPDIDTSIDESLDLALAVEPASPENNTTAFDSSSSSDSTAQGTPLTLSTSTSKRKRRQQDSQSLTCNEPPCTNRSFSDPTCLTRHIREKHGSEMYYCPISTCKRYRKGFPRRFNLLSHKRRCHPDQASSLNEVLEESSTAGRGDGFRNDNSLWVKLNELRELRRGIDEEIGTLEDAARIMSEYEQ